MGCSTLSFWCYVAVINLCLFLMVDPQCVLVVFLGHTHFLLPTLQTNEMLEMLRLVEA